MIHHVVVFSANETGLSAQRSLVSTTVRRIKGLWRYERCNDRLVALELLERRKIIGLTNPLGRGNGEATYPTTAKRRA